MKIIKEKIIPDVTDDELNKIPQYFIDSIEAREDPKSESHKQLGKLLNDIGKLPPLNETLGEIQKVDKDILKEEIQTERRTIRDETELNIRTIETAMFERTKKTLYSGEVMYSDWVEKEGTRMKDKKVLIPPPPNMKTEERERVEVLGERKQVDSRFKGCESGRVLQKRRKIKERRYIQVFEKGEIKELPWKVVSDVEEEVEISKFGHPPGSFSEGGGENTFDFVSVLGLAKLFTGIFSFF